MECAALRRLGSNVVRPSIANSACTSLDDFHPKLREAQHSKSFADISSSGSGPVPFAITGPRRDFAEWKETLSRKNALFYAVTSAEIDLLAAIDPRLAAKQTFRLPRSSLRDPVIVKLIERSIYRSGADAKMAEKWLGEIVAPDLRQRMQVRVAKAITDGHNPATGTILPEVVKTEFGSQLLGALLARLDALASMPVSSGLSQRASNDR